jgi:pyruvate,orthophosphate dikinase
MNDKPVTVRLLDPPLHEFLPRPEQVNTELAKQLGFNEASELIEAIESMHEENPMLGMRGCHLAIARPGLSEMQVEAIINAAADLMEKDPVNAKPRPRIMVPLVGNVAEFEQQALVIKATAEKVKADRKIDVPYEIGTMIEVPRAACFEQDCCTCR